MSTPLLSHAPVSEHPSRTPFMVFLSMGKILPSHERADVLKRAICISRKSSSGHGALNKKAEVEGLPDVAIYL